MPTDHTVSAGTAALEVMEYEVALFIRLSERVRLGAAEAAATRLDRSGYLLLTRLEATGPMSISDLADTLHLDVSTVTRQIAPLRRARLIESVPAQGRRGSEFRLSEAGRTELRAVRSARRELMAEVTAGWTDEERATFADLLARFNVAVQRRRHGDVPTTAG